MKIPNKQMNCFSLKETKDILQQASLNILIIGDGCRDYNHYGSVNRISQEAPVPIFDISHTECKLGMAYNVAENFSSLGIENTIHSYVVDNKHRYIDMKSNHQVYRVDEKNPGTKVKFHISDIYDAIVISDYDKGVLSYEDIENIIKNSTVPVFVDTKKPDLARFGNSILKINEFEYEDRISDAPNIIVTRGNKDVLVIQDNKIVSTHPVDDVELHDTTGAGDSFLAGFVSYFVATNNMSESIKFASASSKVTVTKFGVYAPSLEEICQQD